MSRAAARQLATSALGPSMMSIADIARHLGVSTRTVKRWRADGEVPDPDFENRGVVRWRPSTIEAWIKKRNTQVN